MRGKLQFIDVLLYRIRPNHRVKQSMACHILKKILMQIRKGYFDRYCYENFWDVSQSMDIS